VTGVQTCALPILCSIIASEKASKQKLPNFEAGIKVNFSIAIGKMVAQNIS
jgi:hypothetical protein